MDIYRIEAGGLERVPEVPFKLERDIQDLCEANLDTIFGLVLVRSQFPVGDYRLDTVTWNANNRSFVIIEYKRDANFSVVDQGYAYLATMLDNKADFILEYNEQVGSLKRADVDWSQSRVLFVSSAFTAYQKSAINFKDLPIELWEVHRYANRSLAITRIGASKAAASIRDAAGDSETIKKVSKQVRVYSESDHLEASTPGIVELYEQVKARIMAIASDIEVVPKQKYIAFQVGSRNVVDVHLAKGAIKLWVNLRKGELEDPLNWMRDVSDVGHWGNGDYELKFSDDSYVEYVILLARQSYQHHVSPR